MNGIGIGAQGTVGVSATGTNVGVESTGGTGVLGTGTNVGAVGVQGLIPDTSTDPNTFAVQGFNHSTGAGGIGVQGVADLASGIGVVGTSTAGIGVKGLSVSGFPIIGGVTGPGSASNGNAGVLGIGTAGPGVQGQSHGHGLVGTTSATDGQHAALIGSVQPGGNAIALRGSIPPGATGFAGVFDGDVIVNGALRVFGSPKNAAVKHPGDNTYRLLYCMESPESWFEDFGTGTLVADKADIKLDLDFTALVHTDTYRVFLTPEGPYHLHVAQKTATGFSVMAMAWATQAGGPKAAEGGGTFSWRVVAKRKDIASERLAKVPPPPPLKPVTPFTVPEMPEPKIPTKKP